MPIAAVCTHCEALYKLADDQAGKRVRCRQCRQPFDVPGPRTAARAGTHKIDRPLGVPPAPTPPALPPRLAPPVALPADDPGPERLSELSREPERERPPPEWRPREEAYEAQPSPNNLVLWVGLGLGGALVLVMVLCAGLIYYVSWQVGQGVDRMVDRVKRGQPPVTVARPPITSQAVAVAALQSFDAHDRRRGAEWLASHPPDPDVGRRAEVLNALQPLLNDDDPGVRSAARRASIRWR